ncbi:MAG: sulfur carrier protein ThiS [Chloroflexota bacterium]|nr:MAG: sulfur carrier protein ThiS [Chloroflexota bacterium]
MDYWPQSINTLRLFYFSQGKPNNGQSSNMKLTVNGKPTEIAQEMSIADFLRVRNVAEALVAVEHNLRWVKREEWSTITLKENDRLEVVRIMAGGQGTWGLEAGRTNPQPTRKDLL